MFSWWQRDRAHAVTEERRGGSEKGEGGSANSLGTERGARDVRSCVPAETKRRQQRSNAAPGHAGPADYKSQPSTRPSSLLLSLLSLSVCGWRYLGVSLSSLLFSSLRSFFGSRSLVALAACLRISRRSGSAVSLVCVVSLSDIKPHCLWRGVLRVISSRAIGRLVVCSFVATHPRRRCVRRGKLA